jgi:hypothetical protein
MTDVNALCSPPWFEWVRAIGPMLVTGLIGGVALLIQKNQADTAKAKLALDLFERRLAVFKIVMAELSGLNRVGESCLPSVKFTNVKPEALFLFGHEVRTYLLEVEIQLNNLDHALAVLSANPTPVNQDAVVDLEAWIEDQARGGCENQFKKYMDFSAWS